MMGMTGGTIDRTDADQLDRLDAEVARLHERLDRIEPVIAQLSTTLDQINELTERLSDPDALGPMGRMLSGMIG